MALKKPKKPTFKKYPKKPKQSASVDRWKNYHDKVAQIQKENDARMREYNKAIEQYNQAIRAKRNYQKKVQGMPKTSVSEKKLEKLS